MQRYDLGTIAKTNQKTMYKEDLGRFVLYSEAKAIEEERDGLKAELAKAKEEIERLKEDADWWHYGPNGKARKEAKDEPR